MIGASPRSTSKSSFDVDPADRVLPLGGVHIDASYSGTAGNDRLAGTGDADSFDMSQGGKDFVRAGGGDDSIFMGAALTAADRINGGDGFDTVELQGDYSAGITLKPSSLVSVEQIELDGGFDYALKLADGIVAAGGLLSVGFTSSSSGTREFMHIDGSNILHGDLALRGSYGDDVLIGGAGNDLFRVNLFPHTGELDVVDGGDGYDRISYYYASAGLHLDLNIQAREQDTGIGGLTLSNVEDVTGTQHADTLIGDAHDNFIESGGGSDMLSGGIGNDWFQIDEVGSSDQVTVNGGRGDDLVILTRSFGFQDGVTIDLGSSHAQIIGNGSVTLIGIEDLDGTDLNDTLLGDSTGNLLCGDYGDDRLDGSAGNDMLYGDGLFGFDDPNGTAGIRTLYEAEKAYAGKDTLIGGTGDDTMTGGFGADVFYFAARSGRDIISDFSVGEDKVQIDVKGVRQMSDLTIVSDHAGGALVSWKGGATVDLMGVAPKGLSSTDFAFGPLEAGSAQSEFDRSSPTAMFGFHATHAFASVHPIA